MGIEGDRIRDQIAGQLQGARHDLEVAERAQSEAVDRVRACEESVKELREILARHDGGGSS
jgi:hypothetical protein